MISAADMLGGSWACSLKNFLKKKCNLVRFDVSLHTILGPPPQTSSFACYMRPHSGPFLSFLAYYMGAPSEQFLRIDYGGPLRSVYSLIMEASILIYFFHTIWGPLGSFLCIVYWGPQITFFAYYMGPLRSVSSHTIWGPLSDHFHCLLYGAPLRSVSLHVIGGGGHLRFYFFHKIYGALLRSVSPLTIWGPLR